MSCGSTDELWLLENTWQLTSEDLICKNFDVVRRQRLLRHDDFVKVALHIVGEHIAEGYCVKDKRSQHDKNLVTTYVNKQVAQ